MVHSMAIDVVCTGCNRHLEVDEEFAGQSASCPICQTRFDVPSLASTRELSEPANWSMKTPEGRTYGPVTKSIVDRWVSEGRVSHDCELRDASDHPWESAAHKYAVLRPGAGIVTARGNPFAPSPFYKSAAAPSPSLNGDAVQQRSSFFAAHRGGLVLALGILAFIVTCPVLSFLAWIMGANDLREMREGRMDPSGMGMTQAGMMLGMLLSVLTIIGLMGLVFYVLFRIAL
jgi:hypothetical protein